MRASNNPAERDERLRRYAELRDEGMSRGEAAREVGVSYYSAGTAYERWYRSERGLPPLPQGRWNMKAER